MKSLVIGSVLLLLATVPAVAEAQCQIGSPGYWACQERADQLKRMEDEQRRHNREQEQLLRDQLWEQQRLRWELQNQQLQREIEKPFRRTR
jgi:hypothetical protein